MTTIEFNQLEAYRNVRRNREIARFFGSFVFGVSVFFLVYFVLRMMVV